MMKRCRFLVLLSLVVTSLTVHAAMRGDVNGDGEVNIADVNAVIGIILHTDD